MPQPNLANTQREMIIMLNVTAPGKRWGGMSLGVIQKMVTQARDGPRRGAARGAPVAVEKSPMKAE